MLRLFSAIVSTVGHHWNTGGDLGNHPNWTYLVHICSLNKWLIQLHEYAPSWSDYLLLSHHYTAMNLPYKGVLIRGWDQWSPSHSSVSVVVQTHHHELPLLWECSAARAGILPKWQERWHLIHTGTEGTARLTKHMWVVVPVISDHLGDPNAWHGNSLDDPPPLCTLPVLTTYYHPREKA